MTRVRVADSVGVECVGEVRYVAILPDGPILVLEGSAAVAWDALDMHDVDQIIRSAADSAELGPDDVRDDVVALVRSLMEHGLIAEC